MSTVVRFDNGQPLPQHLIREIPHQLPDLEGLLFDQFCTLARFWRKLLDLHQFRVGEHDPDAIIQIVDQFSNFVRVHGATNLPSGYCLMFMVSCMI